MAGKKTIKFNFIMNLLLNLSSFLFPLITFPYVSRILLPTGTGKVSFATSVVSYFSIFAHLGIPTYGVRACAKVRDDREKLTRVVQELLIINTATSILVYLLLGVAVFNIPRLYEERILILVISASIMFQTIGMEWLYRALENYFYITVRSLVFKVIALAAMFALVKKQEDYVLYGAITIFAASASGILNFFHAHKYIGFKPVGSYDLKRHLKAVMVFFAMSCATTVYLHLDTVMLGFMKSDADVGYYNAAVKIKVILVSVVTSLGAVLLPRLSYFVENGNRKEFERLTKKAMNFVVLLAGPMVLYFILFAREGVIFLSGSAYENSIIPMQIIMPTILLIGMTNVIGIQILVPLGREKIVLYSEIAGAVVDLAANAVLIPPYAAAGAAAGTLLAEIVVWIVQFVALRRNIRDIYHQVKFGWVAAALLIALLSCVWVKWLAIGNLATLIVSFVCFSGAYVLVLTLGREPLIRELEKQMLHWVKNLQRVGENKENF